MEFRFVFIGAKHTFLTCQLGTDIGTTAFTESRDTGRSLVETALRFGDFGLRNF